MINTEKLSEILKLYQKAFVTPDADGKKETGWEKERYKWAAKKTQGRFCRLEKFAVTVFV